MHPIVIVAGDKDPAIGAAVDSLQAAGFEVRVLNTATAKLIDFLAALAGEDDDDEEEKKPDAPEEPKDEKPKEKAPAPEDETLDVEHEGEDPHLADDPLDPKKMEAKIAGEPVLVEIVEGAELVLHPSTIQAGAKTFYTLNESQFSFWPSALSDEPITGGVELELNGQIIERLTKVIFSEQAMNPPVLKIGREWLKTK